MPFATTTKPLILKHNAYQVKADQYTSSSLSQLIDAQLSDIELNLPDLITTIEADLALLETLDASLTTEQGSANATLIQADVLRWSDNKSKTSGISSRYESIRMRIARMLSNSIGDSGSSGQGCLFRG